MTQEDKVFYQEKILEKIEELVQQVFESKGLALDQSMGEDTVCIVCDTLEKVCEKYPDFRCADALKGNTKLDELEKALQRIKDNSYGTCSVCGSKIPKQQLLRNLILSECKECSSQPSKLK
jgi:RNA polymerase-binding transcription factor DksA